MERVAGKLQEEAWKTENLRASKEEKERGPERKRQRSDQGGTHLSFCLPGPYFHICEMGIKPSCLTAPWSGSKRE